MPKKIMKINAEECTGCEACIAECPVDAIWLKDGKAVIDPQICTQCESCVEECPVEAVHAEDVES